MGTARSLLSVCKASREWLSPFVYNSATLCNPHSLICFAKTVKIRPLLGTYVRTLWIGPVSVNEVEQFTTICTSTCKAERERVSYPFARALHRILTRCRSMRHLALIHCPLVSISQWTHIEHALPPSLQTLAMGPDHAMLGQPTFYRSLKHLISIETTLVHVELAHITAFPQLSTLEWIFVPHSGTMKLEWSDPGKFGDKLAALLTSESLRHVKVVSMENIENGGDDCSHESGLGWTTEAGMEMPRRNQCTVVNNAQGHRVRLEFLRRSCVGNTDWMSHLFDEWRENAVNISG
jgi:hypothetical protein